jgi:hypothetical protein
MVRSGNRGRWRAACLAAVMALALTLPLGGVAHGQWTRPQTLPSDGWLNEWWSWAHWWEARRPFLQIAGRAVDAPEKRWREAERALLEATETSAKQKTGPYPAGQGANRIPVRGRIQPLCPLRR